MAEKRKSKGKSNRGGARAGSGRKPKQVQTIRRQIAEDKSGILGEVESTIVDFLPRAIANMILLANGGFERVEEKWTHDPLPDKPGVDRGDAEEELVLAERKTSIAEPDRGANQYLIDRVLGKAVQRLQHDFSNLTDEELEALIAAGDAGGGGAAGPQDSRRD